jgi:hypothetical protein
LCGIRGSLDELLAHCAEYPQHGIDLQPWQCGLCGLYFPAGIDPAIWERSLPDGRWSMAICADCERKSLE